MAAPTDYDAPRSTITAADSLHDLPTVTGWAIDAEQDHTGAAPELPDTDLLDDELTVAGPMQADEFQCTRCFLVWHKSQQTSTTPAQCRDCS